MLFITLTKFNRNESFILNVNQIQTIWQQDNGTCLISMIGGDHTDDIHVKESFASVKKLLGC